jgi:hypothetical protein
MRNSFLLLLLLGLVEISAGQTLKCRVRKTTMPGGLPFAESIRDTSLTLRQREKIVLKAIRKGNVPDFLRQLVPIQDSLDINGRMVHLLYYVTPDYFAIGNDSDFFYMPMTPMLAQKIANLAHCSLPTKLIVDDIYKHAVIKLVPQPIPPSAAMTTVPVFEAHTDSIKRQLQPFMTEHARSALTAGDKKDIILSNKIFNQGSPRVVIYGWYKPDGNPIQPVYNRHKNTWADYSHGVRLVQDKMYVDGKPTTLQKILADEDLCVLLSDEGVIKRTRYPLQRKY